MDCTDCSNLSSEIVEKEASPPSRDHEEEPVAVWSSTLDTQNINGDSVVSFVASGTPAQVNGVNDVSNISNSPPSYCDNKSAYSSMVGCFAACFKCLVSGKK